MNSNVLKGTIVCAVYRLEPAKAYPYKSRCLIEKLSVKSDSRLALEALMNYEKGKCEQYSNRDDVIVEFYYQDGRASYDMTKGDVRRQWQAVSCPV